MGALMISGYGVIGSGGSRELGAPLLLTHRASWEVHFGPIPDGLHVCHHCDVKCCVNPAHLFLGTRKDNMRDAYKKGRMTQVWKPGQFVGSKHPRAILNEEMVVKIRRWASEGVMNKTIARHFGVSAKTVGVVVRGEQWKHIPVNRH